MANTLEKYKHRLHQQLWLTDLGGYSPSKRLFIHVIRLIYAVVNELISGDLILRAMSLIYTTLISMVPLLAVSFSLLKAFGVQEQLKPFLVEFLSPLGAQGQDIGDNIIGFINNMNVGVLGVVGLGMLFYTVISLVQKIEQSFNHIWYINTPRSFLRRITDYLSVLMIGPIMVISALAITASMVSSSFVQYVIAIEPFGSLFYYAGLAIPYLLIIAAFTFMYMFIPNTHVKFGPALVGATVAGILWKVAGMGFASFAAGSTNYNAIYSSFAIMIIFMIWIYISWLIFLIGSQIAFFRQNPEYIRPTQGAIKLSNRQKERLLLTTLYWIGKHDYLGKETWTLSGLTRQLGTPSILLKEIIDTLIKKGLLVEITGNESRYIPAKDLNCIMLTELFDVIRNSGGESIKNYSNEPHVEQLLSHLDQTHATALQGKTLRDWLAEDDK